jgi:hypothetical protein
MKGMVGQMTSLISIEHPARSFVWTAPVSETGEMASEDPLGLDYVAQQVGLLLLPTLTTRSTRAQAYAMVLYGLELANRAIQRHEYENTEEKRRELFERWERFWALATLEYRGGALPRGDWDTMRGVRGAKMAWKPGDSRLPLDFALISRQQELGNLGAYLAPLRRSGLVRAGDVCPTPAALEILESFWDEPSENRHRGRYEEYALAALEPDRSRIDRKYNNLTLGRVGQRSRLTSLVALQRTEQQRRLYTALFERARDTTTYPIANIVESASKLNVTAARDVLDGAIAGRFGSIGPELKDLLVTARAYGDFMSELVGAFDRVYQRIEQGGLVVPRADVASDAFGSPARSVLKKAAAAILDAPSAVDIRRFPMHGAACLRLAEDLRNANDSDALDLLLDYHALVQRDRRRGAGWIREEGEKLVLSVTSYTARPDSQRFPSFKLDAVRTLLTDVGRIPFDGTVNVDEVGT